MQLRETWLPSEEEWNNMNKGRRLSLHLRTIPGDFETWSKILRELDIKDLRLRMRPITRLSVFTVRRGDTQKPNSFFQ